MTTVVMAKTVSFQKISKRNVVASVVEHLNDTVGRREGGRERGRERGGGR